MAAHSQAAAEKRFAALLQPIRDLAQNWAIDVARDLEDYLEELEGITGSFDGGVTSHMFVEAASLIQGSAAIYSRKVEYLYALIYQTLDLITQQRKKKGAVSPAQPCLRLPLATRACAFSVTVVHLRVRFSACPLHFPAL